MTRLLAQPRANPDVLTGCLERSLQGRKAELVNRLTVAVGSSTISVTPSAQLSSTGKEQGAEAGPPGSSAAGDEHAPVGVHTQAPADAALSGAADGMAAADGFQDHEPDEAGASSPAEDVIAFDQTIAEDQQGVELSDFGEGGLDTLEDGNDAEQDFNDAKEAEPQYETVHVKDELQPEAQEVNSAPAFCH